MTFIFRGLQAFAFLLYSFVAQAVIIVYEADGGVVPDHKQTQVREVLLAYTGPGASHFRDNPTDLDREEFSLLLGNEPFGEEKFVQTKLNDLFPNDHFVIQYVPETLWDLAVVRDYLFKYLFWTNNGGDWNNGTPYRDSHSFFQVSFQLKNLFTMCNPEQDVFIWSKNKLIELIGKIASTETITNNTSLMPSQICRAILDHQDLLDVMIQEEVEAARQNQFMFVRFTGGVRMHTPLDRLVSFGTPYYLAEDQYTQDEKETLELLKYVRSIVCNSPHPDQLSALLEGGGNGTVWKKLADSRDKYISNCLQTSLSQCGDPSLKILDFPCYSSTSVAFGILQETMSLKRDTELFHLGSFGKDLSFANSILSGLLFDSYNRSGGGACTLKWYEISYQGVLYTVLLDRKWLFTEGRHLFHVDRKEATQGIMGDGEIFHPRLRRLITSKYKSSTSEDKKYSACSLTDLEYDNDSLSQVSLPYENVYAKSKKVVAKYLLSASEVLSKARIIAIDKQIVSQSLTLRQQADQIILAQKRAHEMLAKQFFGPLTPISGPNEKLT